MALENDEIRMTNVEPVLARRRVFPSSMGLRISFVIRHSQRRVSPRSMFSVRCWMFDVRLFITQRLHRIDPRCPQGRDETRDDGDADEDQHDAREGDRIRWRH